jgi:hypothetical protein
MRFHRKSALVVGVTGHRPNRMDIGEAKIAQRLAGVMSALRAGSRPMQPVAISALAEGSDRIFASVALELGYQLDVYLPFAAEVYEKTFSDPTTRQEFRTLLENAERVEELPGNLSDTKSAYEAVGCRTIEQSHIIVAVWDGAPAAGRGGTAAIILLALAEGKPVIWIDAARDRQPMLIANRKAHAVSGMTLNALAARAKSLTRNQIKRLAQRT